MTKGKVKPEEVIEEVDMMFDLRNRFTAIERFIINRPEFLNDEDEEDFELMLSAFGSMDAYFRLIERRYFADDDDVIDDIIELEYDLNSIEYFIKNIFDDFF